MNTVHLLFLLVSFHTGNVIGLESSDLTESTESTVMVWHRNNNAQGQEVSEMALHEATSTHEVGTTVDMIYTSSNIPSHFIKACEQGCTSVVTALIDDHRNEQCHIGVHALQAACDNNRLDIVKAILAVMTTRDFNLSFNEYDSLHRNTDDQIRLLLIQYFKASLLRQQEQDTSSWCMSWVLPLIW